MQLKINVLCKVNANSSKEFKIYMNKAISKLHKLLQRSSLEMMFEKLGKS